MMDIQNSPTGDIIRSPAGYMAFRPHALSPQLQFSKALVMALSRADYLLGQLAREGAKLPNPHLIMRPFITREAVLSSKIEGTQASLGEVLAADAGVSTNATPNDLQEIQNYITALDYGMERLTQLPLSLRLIKEIHERLMQGVRGSHATPGEFRQSQNWIGTPGCTLNTAKFVPVSPDELLNCLSELEQFLHNQEWPPLLQIAMCHYQFETIHPFLDGNGRVGRLLITLLLIERQLLPSPLLYLSAFFEATRSEYYRYLYEVSAKGDWQEWLTYFLNGVAAQAEDVLSRAERINDLLESWRAQMITGGGAKVLLPIIDLCAVNPYTSVKNIVNSLGLAYSTVLRAVQKLEAANILQQVGNAKRDRVYCAMDVLAVLEEPTKL